jgi:hypothetical protein
MKNHELNACLHFWQERQNENRSPLKFHHWWSEGLKEYMEAKEPQPQDSDDEDVAEAAETQTGTVKDKRKRKMYEKGTKRPKKRQPMAASRGRERSKGDRPNKTSTTTVDSSTIPPSNGHLANILAPTDMKPPKEPESSKQQDNLWPVNHSGHISVRWFS